MKKVLVFILLMTMVFPATSASASDFGNLFGGLTEILGSKDEVVYGVDDTAEINGISVTLDRIMESEGSKDSYLPEDGNVFLICEFTMENNTEEDAVISSIMCFNMKCDDKYYELSLNALGIAMFNGKIQLDQVLEAGKKINGVVGYEVPKDWNNFQLKFTPEIYSTDYLVFSPYPASDE